MININVWSSTNVAIENQDYHLETQADMIRFLKDLLDKIHYGGEAICLEKVDIDIEDGKNLYTTIDRW